MNSERIQEIQAGTGYPQSMSVAQALNQVWNEVAQDQAATIAALRTSADELAAQLAAKDAEVERLGNNYQVKLDDHAKDMSCIEAALNRAGIGLGTTPYQAERGIETAACVDSLRTRADELAARVEALEAAATCACGDQFNTNFRGICPNCDCANRSGMLDRDALAAHDSRVLVTPGVAAIAAERKRQMEVEGWTPTHDDEYGNQQLPAAAVAYLLHDFGVPVLDRGSIPALHGRIWPWDFVYWKPKGPQRNLVRAGALIAAELDRLDRVGTAASETEGGE